MTRAERLARQEALARTQLERQRDRLAKVQAAQREEERKALTKRRLLVGELADRAGLFLLDDTTLGALFALLAPLASVPDPVAVLEAYLSDTARPALGPVNGSAQATPGAAPDGAVEEVAR